MFPSNVEFNISVARIIGSVIRNTLYWLGFMNIGIGSVHLVNCWPIRYGGVTVVNYIFELISGGQEAIP